MITDSFLRSLAALYHRHLIAIAVAGILLVATLAIQICRELGLRNWPQQWEFHHRIRFGRLNHGKPEILYSHPNGAWVHVPYLNGVFEQLKNNDSISKTADDTRLYMLRDSTTYRLTTQWVWNRTTHEFEFAGRSVCKRQAN
ncbi:MAG: hypothetical protein EOO58_03015 [Hymenobacter sp.]|nr:MAG: hypothetical protein EOO58_03015 [Hymenobacter sp.]